MNEAALTWSAIGVLIALMVLWSTVVLAAVRWMISSSEKHIERRFSQIEANAQRATDAHGGLAREVKNLGIELPREYVRREDWIRFSTLILASVDRVHARIDEEKKDLVQVREMLETIVRQTGGDSR